MARVRCKIDDASSVLYDDVTGLPVLDRFGNEIPIAAIEVTCTRCGAVVQVAGDTERSAKRACVMLREQCSERGNFYVFDESELL